MTTLSTPITPDGFDYTVCYVAILQTKLPVKCDCIKLGPNLLSKRNTFPCNLAPF